MGRASHAAVSFSRKMILHLRHTRQRLFLCGEVEGKAVREETLRTALRGLFRGWREAVLEGRGVLHVLQCVLHGYTVPTIVYGEDLTAAAHLFRMVLRVVMAGNVAPLLQDGRALWQATVMPEEGDVALFQALTDLWMRTTTASVLTRAQAQKAKFHTADDALLVALRSPHDRLPITSKTLETDLKTWAAPLFEGSRAALPLVPRRDARGWWLDFTDRPASPDNLPPLARLRLLGQAVALTPILGLPQPWTDAEFIRFLNEAVPILRASAFVIPLPPELELHVPVLHETATAMEEDAVKVVRTITFEGIELTLEEAQAIADAGESLVYLQGAWHYIDLQALRTLLQNIGPEELSARQALPLLLAGALRVAPHAQDIQNFLREMTQPPKAGELPLRDILRPYQAQGVCWLMQAATHGLGVCLADDMGLGKTLQTIALLLSRPGATLVVAPLTVLPVWEREFAERAPNLKILRHDGAERVCHEGFVKLAQRADVVLTAYGYLWRDYSTLRRVKWKTLVLDEAQHIKNPQTRQSQAARSLSAEFRLTLTGTPIENSLEDLWSLLDFLNPDLFGTRREFIDRYHDPDRLRRAIAHFFLRRLKSDPDILSELPPKILQEHYAPLTEAQTAAYDLALSEYVRDTRNGVASGRKGAILALLTRLKQICNGVEAQGETYHSGKLNVLLPLLKEILDQGESTLIFTQFAQTGKRLQAILSEHFGMEIPFIHGELTTKQRRAAIAAFNDDPHPGLFILSLRTGAFGLTLTKANHVVHLDRWWNPAVEAQATDRVHRIGQKRTVVVHHLICRGTLEDSIVQLLSKKRTLAETIVAPTPAALLAKLPTDTLLGLLKRSAE